MFLDSRVTGLLWHTGRGAHRDLVFLIPAGQSVLLKNSKLSSTPGQSAGGELSPAARGPPFRPQEGHSALPRRAFGTACRSSGRLSSQGVTPSRVPLALPTLCSWAGWTPQNQTRLPKTFLGMMPPQKRSR